MKADTEMYIEWILRRSFKHMPKKIKAKWERSSLLCWKAPKFLLFAEWENNLWAHSITQALLESTVLSQWGDFWRDFFTEIVFFQASRALTVRPKFPQATVSPTKQLHKLEWERERMNKNGAKRLWGTLLCRVSDRAPHSPTDPPAGRAAKLNQNIPCTKQLRVFDVHSHLLVTTFLHKSTFPSNSTH